MKQLIQKKEILEQVQVKYMIPTQQRELVEMFSRAQRRGYLQSSLKDHAKFVKGTVDVPIYGCGCILWLPWEWTYLESDSKNSFELLPLDELCELHLDNTKTNDHIRYKIRWGSHGDAPIKERAQHEGYKVRHARNQN